MGFQMDVSNLEVWLETDATNMICVFNFYIQNNDVSLRENI